MQYNEETTLSFPLSIYRIEIDVEYYEKEDGVVSKVAEFLIVAKDVPLSDTIMATSVLAEVSKTQLQ